MGDEHVVSERESYHERFRKGERIASIFHDLILADAKQISRDGELVILDIGCGEGLVHRRGLQRSLAQTASQYIGIEPDPDIRLGRYFTAQYRCLFENAPLQPDSIDVAIAAMVLEHLADPQMFWDKLYAVLRPGGVFWGLTVDARHWFALLSLLTERFHIKDWYLSAVRGERGIERYDNYATYYRSNKPRQIRRMTQAFRQTEIISFHRVGQFDYYTPVKLRWLVWAFERLTICLGLAGVTMAVRVEK
jgi:SAM-dependent methyltransferase